MSEAPELAHIRQRLDAASPRALPADGMRASAVVVPVLADGAGRLRVLFTLRTDTVGSHQGQISFPGGCVDPDDAGPREAALRELDEELGVVPTGVDVLGRLSDVPTITGFLITPFVAWVGVEPALAPHPHEVAEVFTVPLDDLLAGRVPSRTERIEWQGHERAIFFYDYEGYRIWGATAAILHELLGLLADRGGSAHA